MNQLAEEVALFDSLHQALTFAYRYSGQQYSPSLMARLMQGGGKSGKGLSGLDGAAQAGLIRGIIGKLDVHEQNMISAKFSFSEKERIQAMMELVQPAIASMGSGCHSRRVAEAMVQRYFGHALHLADYAAHNGVSAPTMTRRWQEVRNSMKQLWERAEEDAHRELQNAGIIL